MRCQIWAIWYIHPQYLLCFAGNCKKIKHFSSFLVLVRYCTRNCLFPRSLYQQGLKEFIFVCWKMFLKRDIKIYKEFKISKLFPLFFSFDASVFFRVSCPDGKNMVLLSLSLAFLFVFEHPEIHQGPQIPSKNYLVLISLPFFLGMHTPPLYGIKYMFFLWDADE